MTPTLEDIEKLLAQENKPCPFCGKNPDLEISPDCAYCKCSGDIVLLRIWNPAYCWQLVEWLVKELKQKEK